MNIKTFKNIDEITIYLTDYLVAILNKSVGRIALAISGGNTPVAIFKNWAKNNINTIDWDRIEFFWVDERCVPETSKESNYGVARKILLDKIPIEKQHIYCIDGENDPEVEAEFQSERLLTCLNRKNGIPQFDIILLGMGSDGHTASIFPNQMHLLVSGKFYDVGIHPQTKQKRVTLTGPVIQNAKNVLFIVTGKEKAPVFDEIKNSKVQKSNYPAALIKPQGTLLWLIDEQVSEKK